MGREGIPLSGLSAKEPPSELSKCRVIKPPMCKALQTAPLRTTWCTVPCSRGPPLSALEPPGDKHQPAPPHGLATPQPAVITHPSSWGLSVCSDGELVAGLAANSALPAGPSAPWLLTKHKLNVWSELSPVLFPGNFHFLGGEMVTFAPSCREARWSSD